MSATNRKPPTAFLRAASLIALSGAITGALTGTTGCGKNTRANPDKPTSTNAGLANLTRDDDTLTIDPAPADSFAPTREWALQAASQLEEIMDKIPGAPGYNPDTAAARHAGADAGSDAGAGAEDGTAGVGRSGRSGEAGRTPLAITQIDPTDAAGKIPEPEPAEPAETTRFSLSAFAGDEDTDTAIDAAGTGSQNPPELAAGNAEPDPKTDPKTIATSTPVRPVASNNPEERKQQLVDELVSVLGELAMSGDGPGSAALALAGLESLRPQALDALKGQGVLSDAEIASLDAARELFGALSSENGIAGPGEVSAVLDRIRRDLDARAGVRISRAELCTRVTGFGRFDTFPSNRFIAGRAQPVIIYTEVDRFAHRETTGPDAEPRFEIEVSQRLELYHTADNLNTWNRAAETDRTISRNRVRDYYLINQVTLPSNLSIGKYHLKVVVRDLVGGQVAETIIPIEIVSSSTASGL